ncbi:MAG: hypothetical protein HOV79_08070 [Hamadaea sp.]|nr:hypothetical protein [Hamadaea sp.]
MSEPVVPQPVEPTRHDSFPGFTPVPPPQPTAPRRSRLALWLSIGVAALLVLCVGGGVAAYVGLRTVDKAVEAAASPSPSVSPSPTARVLRDVTVVAPAKLAGMPKVTTKDAKKQVEQVRADELANLPEGAKVVSGFYASKTKKTTAVLVAATGHLSTRDAVIDQLKDTIVDTYPGFAESLLDAGPLGGRAFCGDFQSEGTPGAVCAWADYESYGYVIFFNTTTERVRDKLIALRATVEIVKP